MSGDEENFFLYLMRNFLLSQAIGKKERKYEYHFILQKRNILSFIKGLRWDTAQFLFILG